MSSEKTVVNLEKVYNPQEIEAHRYNAWEAEGDFQPSGTGPGFSIVIPPPNVTGVLHMGHALNMTLQDIIVRQKRMQGYRALWVPGSDHAGIATQNVVEKQLAKEHTDRHTLGRETFVERVWQWKKEYGDRITRQIRRLGASVDWTHERFTMDEGLNKAVIENFVKLYEQGFIYRGKYIINWCPRCHTALSDIEVNHEECQGHLWEIRYISEDGKNSLIIATTRPETMFGDTAIAVHPDDMRYKHLIGKFVHIPFTNKLIPVIADGYVDKDFGTGAVKITPAHDMNDFEMGNRHNLERVLIMDETGVMNENAPEQYRGMDRHECRKALVKDLDEQGFLMNIKDHTLSIGHCYRCNTVIEPYLSNQWFVAMKKLADPAIEAVRNKAVTFTPNRWEKLYFEWMESIRDWCISRQIWWGHRIPVWYCPEHPTDPIVSRTTPDKCPLCGSTALTQDNDVLDTWFSSALWPFSTLGWPEQTEDLATYYPTSLLVTGYDILTFWVSRMVVMGLFNTGQVPFSDVYIHGLVRDQFGKKMSKSLGNALDPLELIDEFGADALRFSLASLCTMGGQDIKFSRDKIQASRNFCNKIWNVSRYIIMILNETTEPIDVQAFTKGHSIADHWIISQFFTTLQQVNQAYAQYNYAQVADILYDFTWNKFCDWFIEMNKIEKQSGLPVLLYVFTHLLKLLHPFLPFITDEIWSKLHETEKIKGLEMGTLMRAHWPEEKPRLINETLEQEFNDLIDLIREVRNLRKQLNLQPGVKCPLMLIAREDVKRHLMVLGNIYIKQLAKVSYLEVFTKIDQKPAHASSSVVAGIQIYIPLDGLIDFDKEKARLQKRLKDIEAELMTAQRKLANESFLEKAPEDVVVKLKETKDRLMSERKIVETQIQEIFN